MTRWLPWLVFALLFAAGAVIGYRIVQQVIGQRDAEAAAKKSVQAELLKARGQIVIGERVAKDLVVDLAEMAVSNAALKEALEKARKAAKGARVVAVARASTGEVTAGGEPISTRTAEQQPCLLAPGDAAEVRVDEVVLATREGNRMLVGTASAWRLSPPPLTQIAGGPFSAEVTWATAEVPPAADRGWSTLEVGGVAVGSFLAGVIVKALAD